MPRRLSDAERIDAFWAKVDRTDACWIWTGARDRQGYGNFGDRPGHTTKASIFAYDLTYTRPPGAWVLHHCDNPPCVRPDHLFAGDSKANSDDKWAKGRGVSGFRKDTVARGERNGVARLTSEGVMAMRRRYSAGETGSALAAEYGVCAAAATKAITGETWSHLPESMPMRRRGTFTRVPSQTKRDGSASRRN
jgi:hypothetical protein